MLNYVNAIPRELPDGVVLVHNHVRPASPIGMSGFRIWCQSPSDEPELVVCDCGWPRHSKTHIKTHYRVKGPAE